MLKAAADRLRSALHGSPPTAPRIGMTGSVLMTDIEGSVALWDADPEAMNRAVIAHSMLIEQLVTRHGGHFVSSRGEGDATFSVFARATDAVSAAAALQSALLSASWPTKGRLRVRIAINTGLLEDRDEELVGAVPNRCARLRALIAGDQVVVSEATAQATADAMPEGWLLTSIGLKVLRGLRRPERAYLLRPIGSAPTVTTSEITSDLAWVIEPPTPLVGRRRELEICSSSVDRLLDTGDGNIVLVGGEPGIGKTRLLGEVAQDADAKGALVLFGRCDEHAVVPFQPFVEALEHVVDADPYALSAGELTADLTVLFPQLADRVAHLSPPRLDPETRRYRMFDAVDRALDFLATSRPVVVLLDDLQWADHSTLLLLRHVTRAVAGRRLLMIIAFRNTELTSSGLQDELVSLRRRRPPVELGLSGLTTDDIVTMLESQAGHHIGEEGVALAQRLQRETAGNSLFVQEVMRHLVESGQLVHRNGVWELTHAVGEFGIPDNLSAVVRMRTGLLSEAAQTLLSCASVIGSDFDLALAGEVAGLDADQALGALEETLAHRLVVEQGAPDQLTFAHAVVHRTLYDGMSSARRAHLHHAVARALDRDDERELPVDELARHYAAAGGPGRAAAVRYGRMAGDRALRALAFEVAAGHYRRALDAAGSDETSVDRVELLLALADAQNRFGDIEEAKPSLLEGFDLAGRMHRPDLAARAALAYGGVIPTGIGIDQQAIELLRAGLEGLPDDDGVEQALLGGRLVQEEYWVCPRQERDRRSASAVEMARRVGDDRTLAAVLLNRYGTLDGPVGVVERLGIGTEVEQLGRALEDPELVAQGAKCRLHALLGLGAVEADAVAQELHDLANEMRQPEYLRLSLGYEATRAANAGRFEEAEALARRARSILQARGQRVHASIAHAMQVLPWRWLQGRLSERAEYHRQLVAIEPSRPTWRGTLSWIEAELGDEQAAEEHLDALALDRYLGDDPTLDWWPVTIAAGHSALILRRTDVAEQLYAALAPYGGRNAAVGQVMFLGAVDHHLGGLAASIGRWDDAIAHHEAALARHERMGATAYEALSHVALAEAIAGRGRSEDTERSRTCAAVGRRMAEELGLPGVQARANAALRRAGAPPGDGG